MTTRARGKHDYSAFTRRKGLKPAPPHNKLRTIREPGDVELVQRPDGRYERITY